MSLAVERLGGLEGAPMPWVVGTALLLLLGGLGAIALAHGWRQGALFGLGAGLGLVLYHAAFGFASSWRHFLVEGRGAGLRAQMLMLALATLIFLPVLEAGSLFGQPVAGAVAPAGLSVLIGAFLFGLGMQLGGGCASGTLYTVGGGSTRMVAVLAFFIVGSLLGSAHLPWWLELPSLGAVSLPRVFGLEAALGLQLTAFALFALATVAVERSRHRWLDHGFPGPASVGRRLLRGPWPLVWGAVLLALLNVATLALAGHPWTVSFGYALWGAKLATAAGIDVAAWSFWSWPFPSKALASSVFATSTSTMNFGILVGAFLAAGLAGRFAPVLRVPVRSLLAAALGGILMGYGARLAFGCNVGAFFSGIASGSLHGWLWFASALVGTYAGAKLRPAFGLGLERSR